MSNILGNKVSFFALHCDINMFVNISRNKKNTFGVLPEKVRL